MKSFISTLLKEIVDAFYKPLPIALIIAFLFMYLYKSGYSFKEAIAKWGHWFMEEREFRRVFLLALYVVLVLFCTILSRTGNIDPCSNLLGSWGIYKYSFGEMSLTAEPLENVVLFVPFSFLLFWSMGNKVIEDDASFWKVLGKAFLIGFLFSFGIESVQLLTWKGTWQLSDLFNNTLGSVIGGFIYWCLRRICKR